MGDGWGRSRIGAGPYDRVPCGSGFVERVCRNVVYYIDSMAVTDTRTPVEAKEALDAFKRSSKPKRTGKPDAVEDATEMPETIDMAEDEKQADW